LYRTGSLSAILRNLFSITLLRVSRGIPGQLSL
jgi:hypothetical protein